MEQFIRIVRRLRKECPWDRKQTHQSLRHSLIEETYEVVEALDRNNLEELKKELGDLLLHVMMQTTIAEQAGEFALRDVVKEITDKLVRRHPHVFGTRKVRNASEVRQNWEDIKMEEGRRSLLEGVPRRMPALQRALRIQQRAAKVGFDWSRAEDVWKKVHEELAELRTTLKRGRAAEREEEFGDFLFALVNYARFLDINPEDALRATIAKFTHRFQFIEGEMKKRGKNIRHSTLEEMDALWNEAKRRKRSPAGNAGRPA
jgi:XTP/dITP diphosphohydrolase